MIIFKWIRNFSGFDQGKEMQFSYKFFNGSSSLIGRAAKVELNIGAADLVV